MCSVTAPGYAALRSGAAAQLKSGVAVALGGALGDHVHAVHVQDGDRNMRAVLAEHPGHPEFLGDHAGAEILSLAHDLKLPA